MTSIPDDLPALLNDPKGTLWRPLVQAGITTPEQLLRAIERDRKWYALPGLGVGKADLIEARLRELGVLPGAAAAAAPAMVTPTPEEAKLWSRVVSRLAAGQPLPLEGQQLALTRAALGKLGGREAVIGLVKQRVPPPDLPRRFAAALREATAAMGAA